MKALSRRKFLALAGGTTAGVLGLTACGTDDTADASGTSSASGGTEFDDTVWREHGSPLVEATGSGSLDGQTLAVKDLYSVEEHVVGAGNEEWLAQAAPEESTAPAVAAFLAAGASIAGISRTDEFAYSLAGTNAHYGTPPNPASPGRIPGGSSSGSATAVSLGEATIGLGTDTGGSIRIPASYQGLFGIRTTHDAISREGLLPLAPSFDTVGWMTNSQHDLAAVADVLEPDLPETVDFPRCVYSPALFELADPDVASAMENAVESWSQDIPLDEIDFDTEPLTDWVAAFQTRQGWEAWEAHGEWIQDHWDSLNPDVRSRFETASEYTEQDLAEADDLLTSARKVINETIGDAVLILPSSSSVAPDSKDAELGSDAIEDTRARTFQLTCLAGITGRPAVSSPAEVNGLPIGICAVGPRDSDRALARLQVN
ncbi:MAG: amidase family protein [Mycobacteriaceae bacterium]|uniref:amidase family protein n=1 Tax=Corynebacterium sp. TaxID=1720 RepID=UPI003F98A0EF